MAAPGKAMVRAKRGVCITGERKSAFSTYWAKLAAVAIPCLHHSTHRRCRERRTPRCLREGCGQRPGTVGSSTPLVDSAGIGALPPPQNNGSICRAQRKNHSSGGGCGGGTMMRGGHTMQSQAARPWPLLAEHPIAAHLVGSSPVHSAATNGTSRRMTTSPAARRLAARTCLPCCHCAPPQRLDA